MKYGLHALLGHGERGDAKVVLGAHGRNDGVEGGGDGFSLQAEYGGDGLGQVDVEANRGLAVFGQEFGRSVRGIGADGQRAVAGHGIRQQCGDLVVLLDVAGVEALNRSAGRVLG